MRGQCCPRKGKAKAQRLHAKRRGAERYGLNLSNDDLAQIVRLIQEGKATLIEKQSNRVTIFDVEMARCYNDEPHTCTDCTVRRVTTRVVYDKERKQIASFLPR
jgi:uncharacterized protein YjhX (UPF0386 family)